MTDHVNLEIRLRTLEEAGHYTVETSLRRPDSGAPTDRTAEAQFDLEALEALELAGDRDAYGQTLADSLFGPQSVRDHFVEARQAADDQDPPLPLRVRLRIEPSAFDLHKLRWELMHDPEKHDPETPGSPLSLDENKPLSRFLTSPDGRPVRTRPQAGIRALVVIANPSNLAEWRGEDGAELAPVPVEEELARACKALLPIPVTALYSDSALDPAGLPTLQEMLSHLRDGYDVLYLVAHGALLNGRPLLYLEDGEGKAHVVAADDTVKGDGMRVLGFVSQLDSLPRLPRLVVLASCQSASHGTEGEGPGAGPGGAEAEPASRETRALAALGPRLADIGVPAVLAMQGSITMTTVESFMPVLFAGLRRDGHIDRAVAAARRAVYERPDWWMPVLFSRLEDGLLFSQRGRIVDGKPEVFWQTLLRNIELGQCTPILGPGVTVDFLPSLDELAERLAHEKGYPLSYSHNMARVGQFVATADHTTLCLDVLQALAAGFKRRMSLQPEPADSNRSLSKIIEEAGWSDSIQDLEGGEIHHQLADLNLPLYLTTNYDNFMTLALQAKRPDEDRHKVHRDAIDWLETVSGAAGRPGSDLSAPPTADQPVVLHLFGTDDDLPCMVLTEDDYMDFLARIFRDHQAILPSSVRPLLVSSSLLLLGYNLHDLALKVILRGLLANLNLRKWKRKHVAVQIEPSTVDPTGQQEVVDYLKAYFAQTADWQIDVYWGSAHQFVADLHSRLPQEVGHG